MTSVGEHSLVQSLYYLSESQAATSNNIANTSSSGFKRRITMPVETGSRFDDFLNTEVPQTRFSQHIDWAVGSIINTDDPSNIALEDKELFFRVKSKTHGFVYSRTSKLAIGDNGYLTTANGDLLVDDADAPIALSASQGDSRSSFEQLQITLNGTISMEGNAKKIGIYKITDLDQLRPVGGGNYAYMSNELPPLAQTNHVRQRYMERSNVETMGEMINMISNQRGFSSTMSALSTLDKIRQAYMSGFNR